MAFHLGAGGDWPVLALDAFNKLTARDPAT